MDQMSRGSPWVRKLLEWAWRQQKPITSTVERNLAEANFDVNKVSGHIWEYLVLNMGEKQERFRTSVEASMESGRGLELWRLLLDEFDSQALTVAKQKSAMLLNPTTSKNIDTFEHDLEKWLEMGADIENIPE